MNITQQPVVFSCQGSDLIGMIYVPECPTQRGLLAIEAGGPQYRAGCCRNLVELARIIAADGTAVMSFDYRGLGDSHGEFHGFESITPDLQAAIDAFSAQVPAIKEIILWGGCDAASAALLHAPELPQVAGMILGNPFVHDETTYAKVVVKHYYWQRLVDKSFWLRVLKLRVNVWKTLVSVLTTIWQSRQSQPPQSALSNSQHQANKNLPYPVRMCHAANRFQGRILLLMSGQSLVSKEFDELVAGSPQWQAAIHRPGVMRVDFPDADQAFSTMSARQAVIATARRWLNDWAVETV